LSLKLIIILKFSSSVLNIQTFIIQPKRTLITNIKPL